MLFDGIGWNVIRMDVMGWDVMTECDVIGWDGIGCDGIEWDVMGWVEMG